MIIPVDATQSPGGPREWSRLDPEAKRERLLNAATDVFARHGLDAPMSEVAEVAGAGVASIYRAFGSKHELLATLVTRRMNPADRRRVGVLGLANTSSIGFVLRP